MWIEFASLVLLALYTGLVVLGMLLLRRRGEWKVVGVVLLLEALLLIAMQVIMSTEPIVGFEPMIRVPFWELLGQALAALAAVLGVAALLYWGSRWLSRRLGHAGRRRTAILAGLLLLLPLLATGALVAMWQLGLPERERERDPDKRQLVLEPGFSATIYAQCRKDGPPRCAIDNPTVMTFGPDGKLYIGDISGTLWVASDVDGDHVAETITAWASGFELLVGLAWGGNELFASSAGKIEALRDSDGDGTMDQRRLVIGGLPSMVLKPHSNNGLTFGPDGRLYFGVGSTTSGEFEQEEHAAAVLSVKPDGSDLKVFARGFGNPFDIAFNKAGHLFGGDNSPLGQGGEELSDEFNFIEEGGHYGFPYFYGDPKDGGARGALVSFPPHSVPTGVTFYEGNAYPQRYQSSALITLWQRGEIARIEVAQTEAGAYLSRTSTFASGFLYPIDVVTGPDGNLYVADFGTSVIYRITYDGPK